LITSEFEQGTEVLGNLRSHVEVSNECCDSGLARVCQQVSLECYGM